MNFKELTKGSEIYLIKTTDSVSVQTCEVQSVGLPRYEALRGQMGGVNVTDLCVRIGDRQTQYVIPENSTGVLHTEQGDILTADSQSLVTELKRIKAQAEGAVTEGKRAETRLSSLTELLSLYDVEFKTRQETEERMSKMESNINRLTEMFSDFMKTSKKQFKTE